jgi:hypothetical protein
VEDVSPSKTEGGKMCYSDNDCINLRKVATGTKYSVENWVRNDQG